MSKNMVRYQNRMLRELYFAETLPSAELSRRTGLSLPLVNKTLNELAVKGVVQETGYAPSTGGRKPQMYSLKGEVHFIVAVALDQFITRITVVDLNNRQVIPVEQFHISLSDNATALVELVEQIDAVIQKSGVDRNKVLGIGIGIPGFIDVKEGVSHSFLRTEGESLTAYITARIGMPVFIDNDSRLVALAELHFGAARGKRDVMVVNVGWGVGLGLILNGQMFTGHNGFAGEFSHIPLFANGKLCSCGKRGCLETETSLMVVIKKAREGLQAGRLSSLQPGALEDLEEASDALAHAAVRGDQFTIELFSEAGYNIGRGVAVLIHLLNPELIVLSGRGSAAGKIWQAPIQHALNEHCIPRMAERATVEISTLGYMAELTGAAALVMEGINGQPPESKRKKQFTYGLTNSNI